VTFTKAQIVQNHFKATENQMGGASPSHNEVGAANQVSVSGNFMDSPLKPSRSSNSFSISGKEGSYSGSANLSSHSA